VKPSKHQPEIDAILAGLSAEFRALWQEWRGDRRARRLPLTPFAEVLQLRRCRQWGEAKARLAIETAVEHGWRGLFEPASDPALAGRKPARRGPTPKEEREAAVHALVDQLWDHNKDAEAFKRVLSVARDKYRDFGRNEAGQDVLAEALDIVSFRRQNWRDAKPAQERQ
jgi:hypothetical protein